MERALASSALSFSTSSSRAAFLSSLRIAFTASRPRPSTSAPFLAASQVMYGANAASRPSQSASVTGFLAPRPVREVTASTAAFQAGFTAFRSRSPCGLGLASGCWAMRSAASARLPSMPAILSTFTSTAPASPASKPMSLQRMKKSATLFWMVSTAARASAVLSPNGKTSLVAAACQASKSAQAV